MYVSKCNPSACIALSTCKLSTFAVFLPRYKCILFCTLPDPLFYLRWLRFGSNRKIPQDLSGDCCKFVQSPGGRNNDHICNAFMQYQEGFLNSKFNLRTTKGHKIKSYDTSSWLFLKSAFEHLPQIIRWYWSLEYRKSVPSPRVSGKNVYFVSKIVGLEKRKHLIVKKWFQVNFLFTPFLSANLIQDWNWLTKWNGSKPILNFPYTFYLT